MLTVYGRADSNNVQPVMWLIAELGVSHERLDFGQRFGGTDTPDFLAMNPMGLVPVIKDGDDEPISEAGAILRYLAARYGDGGAFWPNDPRRRAQVDRWAEWAKIEVASAFQVPVFMGIIRTKPETRDTAALEKAIAALDRRLDIAEAKLSQQDYLAGPDFTLADIVLGSLLFRYFTVEMSRKERPHLSAYYERLSRRPAYAEHVMVSYEALRIA
ncbi:glutathione S-transferase family protein [Fulvimarina sp. MAC3]|uniref:glutathione S-transferase family protein n=1 Tax=Fulvimarina sp. MAC3 TaxID=3148887 RepID=UPI0031FC4E8C